LASDHNEYRGKAGSNAPVTFYFPYRPVRFDVNPADAEVLLNGKPREAGISRPLRPGDYAVQVSRAGYKPAKTNITVVEGKVTMGVPVKLEPMLGFCGIHD